MDAIKRIEKITLGIAFEQKEKETQIENEQTNKNKKEKNNSEFLALIGLRTTQGPG